MKPIVDLRTDAPVFTHRLGVALQFFDAFTQAVVRTPLRVTLPERRLVAPVAGDGIYRVLVPAPPFPPQPETLAVTVEALAGDYVSHEPISVALPRTPATPPPPARRVDYLLRAPLWPTVRVRPPPGETALLGHVVQGPSPSSVPAAGYKVVLCTDAELPDIDAVPYARSDERGDFLCRLSRFTAGPDGNGDVVSSVHLNVLVFDQANVPVSPVHPASVTVDLGRSVTRQFSVPVE